MCKLCKMGRAVVLMCIAGVVVFFVFLDDERAVSTRRDAATACVVLRSGQRRQF